MKCVAPRGRDTSRSARRSVYRSIAAALLASCLAGCIAWPESGTGGLAELYPSKSIRIAAIEQRLLELADGGVNQYAPAKLLEARGWLIRAKREHAGGLLADAELSAARAEDILDELQQKGPRSKAAYRAAAR